MALHFTQTRWETLRQTYARWWARSLDRPVIKLMVADAFSPEREMPRAPFLSQANCHDFSYTPEEVIDRIDYELSKKEFLGDAFPIMRMDCFGPGVLAAFCGARLDNSSGGVWFFPEEALPLSEITVRYDPENRWVKRIKTLYAAGHARWQGTVLMGMPDLGGVLDVAATFRGSENLLMDLYDDPDEVLRLCGEIEVAWMDAYRDFMQILAPINPGCSNWHGVYSEKPCYIPQSDFSYMIGNDMFRQFTLPSLKQVCRDIPHTIYHLDGIGQLAHLDDVLSIEALNAVQWVYGDGQPGTLHWLEVYKKIAAAEKGICVEGSCEEFAALAARFNKNLYFTREVPHDRLDAAWAVLKPFIQA